VQQAFFGLFDGTTEDRRGWLDLVAAHATPSEPAAPPSEAPAVVAETVGSGSAP
jgi:hypothetical protein